MRRVKLDESGCSVNFDHIVSVERKEGWQIARLVSGTTVVLKDVYPIAHDLFQISHSPGVWVNAAHVSVVDVGYNKDAAFRDIVNQVEKSDKDYMQLRIETVLGEKHMFWSDIYGVDEVDYVSGLLDTSWDGA